MSKHLFTFFLTELGTVRLTCLKCKKVAEMTMDDLAFQSPGVCPFCQALFKSPQPTHAPLQAFAEAAIALRGLAKIVNVEFVLPAESPTAVRP